MSRQTMSFALPDSMRNYIDARVSAGNYGNTSEYIRDLVRKDQDEQARKRLRDLIEAGLASGPGRARTKADDKELQSIARGEID
jgi:antitoxin ParD1/3/4